MKIKRRSSIITNLGWALLLAVPYIIFSPVLSLAELKIDSVYPTLGQLGQNMQVDLRGTGFNANTRITMSLDSPNTRTIIGSVDTPSDAWGVFVSGSYAYVADGYSGLQVIDISNPRSPQIIGSIDTPGDACDVFVTGSYAYVADGGSGLQVIDVSNPRDFRIIGSVDTPGYAGYANDIEVIGDNAYVANRDAGLQVIDISNPQSPQIIGTVDTPDWACRIIVSGYYAYVACWGGGLQVIDISNPQSPQIIGAADTPGEASSVFVSGSYAYVADEYSGLQVIDVSNPQSPQIIGAVDTPDVAQGVAVVGDYAYVADGRSGIQLIDVSNSQPVQVIGTVDTPEFYATGINVIGDKAYLSENDDKIQIIDISDSQNPQVMGTVYANIIIGDYAYSADLSSFQVIDISNPQNPQIIGSVNTPGYPTAVTVIGGKAYIGLRDEWQNGSIQVIDISDPQHPLILGSVDTFTYPYEIAISGDKAYVAVGWYGIQVIDFTNPQNPQIIGYVDTPYDAYGITIIGDKAYVKCIDGISMIDISDPRNPWIICSVNAIYAADIAIEGDYVYIAFYNRFGVIDLTDPQNPIISSVDMPGLTHGITVIGDKAYVADDNFGIHMIDISNLRDLQIMGFVDTLGCAQDIEVIGDKAYVADGYSGLVIVPLPIEIEDIIVNSESSISLTLASPLIAGHYNLMAFNGTESYELFGAVSFTGDASTLRSKAIIVAGGGPNASGGTMWEETKVIANKAYDTLIMQGYDHDSIYYISEEILNEYVDSSSPDTFLSDLSNAINVWAADASQLLIYFVDHGQEGEFIFHADSDTTQTLTVQDLEDWLDTLQETMTGPVTFIYDACQSGSFISKMRPPDGKERIIITGSSYEPAYFLEDGKGSFSFQFWDKITSNRGNLGDAFLYAKDAMQSYQSARIEANWDFEDNNNESEDISIAKDTTIQRGGYAYIGVHPFVTSVSDPQILSSGTSMTIQASGVIDSEGVYALIIPPDINPETSDIPITDLPTIELTDPDGDHTYEGVYDGFDTEGTYVVVVKSIATHELYSYVNKTMTTHDIYSPPMYTSVTKTNGIQNIEPDSYEEDDTYSQASIIVLNDDAPQVHNFNDVGDEDWVKFYGISGQTYKIKTSNVSVFCDPVIEVFDNDGTTLLAGPIDNNGAGKDESVEWTCPEEGLYYVKITNANSNFGENVRYELKVYRPIQGIPGWLMGMVIDILGQGISGAVIKSNVSNTTAITNSSGFYIMALPSGIYTITSSASGYNQKSATGIIISAEGQTTQNFVMYVPNADTDGDGMPDGWEVQYNLNPLVNDASIDPDKDGYTNLQEYREGGDPTDSATPFPWELFYPAFTGK